VRVRVRGLVRESDAEVGLDRACRVGALPRLLLAVALRLFVVLVLLDVVCPPYAGGARAAGDLAVLRGAARA
jgi:hypothetical protein